MCGCGVVFCFFCGLVRSTVVAVVGGGVVVVGESVMQVKCLLFFFLLFFLFALPKGRDRVARERLRDHD